MPYCPHCGNPYKMVHEYCPKCGEPTNSAPQNVEYFGTTRVVADIGNTSGQGKHAEVPPEIKGWNWGAFFLHWIWGIGNNVWIALIALVGIIWPIGLAISIVLGIKGSEWAWQNKRWDSINHFKSTQKTWAWVGFGIAIFGLILILASIIIPNVAKFIDEENTTGININASHDEYRKVQIAVAALMADCGCSTLTAGGVVGANSSTFGKANDDICNVMCDGCSHTLQEYLRGADDIKCNYAFTTGGEVRQSSCPK